MRSFILSFFVFFMSSYAFGNLALISAARSGNVEEVRNLILQGADVNYQDTYCTALSAASENGHLEVVQLLINSGDTSLTAGLARACDSRQPEIAKLLLKNGAQYLDWMVPYLIQLLGEHPDTFIERERFDRDYLVALMQGTNALIDEISAHEIVSYQIGGHLIDLGVVYAGMNDGFYREQKRKREETELRRQRYINRICYTFTAALMFSLHLVDLNF